jgi:CheY-like chemotaxis protein
VSDTVETRVCVLVVEDEPLVRADLAEGLRQAGLQVLEAANGSQALAVLRSNSEIALMVTDIRMPGDLDGLGVARWARSELPQLKIVLVTGNFITDLETPIDAIFSKPYVLEDLVKRIVELVTPLQHARGDG